MMWLAADLIRDDVEEVHIGKKKQGKREIGSFLARFTTTGFVDGQALTKCVCDREDTAERRQHYIDSACTSLMMIPPLSFAVRERHCAQSARSAEGLGSTKTRT